ncbi:MAG: S49 family peptidase [Sedimentisphaerales bacterium]
MSKENAILAEMQKEVWAMEPRHLNALFTHLLEIEIKAPAGVEIIKEAKLSIIGDTAVIRISGILLKNIPSLYRWLGIEMTRYLDIQGQLAEAVGNPAVRKILLDIDSPGGVVSGVMETGQAIADAALVKPVTAKIDDLGASGAYWLASQTTMVSAGPNAEVGSIGVFTVYVDWSVRADKKGMKVHIVRSGEHKGMGVPGAPITAEQIAAVQTIIDGMADNFIKAVSSGRKMSVEAVRELADGRVFLAADAVKNGLIDNVITVNKQSNVKEKITMAEEQKDNKAAAAGADGTATVDKETVKKQVNEAASTGSGQEDKVRLSALRAAFPDEPAFVLEQFEKGATVEQAKAAYADILKTRNAELKEQNAELAKKTKKATGGAPPVPPGGEGGSQTADAFIDMAKQYAEDHKCSMAIALKAVRKKNPQAFNDYMNSCRQQKVAADGE